MRELQISSLAHNGSPNGLEYQPAQLNAKTQTFLLCTALPCALVAFINFGYNGWCHLDSAGVSVRRTRDGFAQL